MIKKILSITELKDRLSQCENEINKLIGKKESLLSDLKENFNIKSVKQAEKELEKKSKELLKLRSKEELLIEDIESDLEEIEKQLGI